MLGETTTTATADRIAADAVLRAQAYQAGREAYLDWERHDQADSGEDDVWHAALVWAAQHRVSPPFAHGYVGSHSTGAYVWQRPDAILTGAFAVAWPAFRNGWCDTADSYGVDPYRWYYVSVFGGGWRWR